MPAAIARGSIQSSKKSLTFPILRQKRCKYR